MLHTRVRWEPSTNRQGLSQLQLAAEKEQQERQACLRRSPPLDARTQQAIARDYRALHEQIKAAGLYHCRYSDYAVEGARCAPLLAAFVYPLRCGWYVTSALFLSMFWVSPRHDLYAASS
jgi:delta8-fatty-acid desaturase